MTAEPFDLTPEAAEAMVAERVRTDPAVSAAPRLVHSGTYALYETPDGGRHLVYRPTTQTGEDGHLLEATDAEDMHLPDIPPAALPLVNSFLEHGFPPAILTLLATM